MLQFLAAVLAAVTVSFSGLNFAVKTLKELELQEEKREAEISKRELEKLDPNFLINKFATEEKNGTWTFAQQTAAVEEKQEDKYFYHKVFGTVLAGISLIIGITQIFKKGTDADIIEGITNPETATQLKGYVKVSNEITEMAKMKTALLEKTQGIIAQLNSKDLTLTERAELIKQKEEFNEDIEKLQHLMNLSEKEKRWHTLVAKREETGLSKEDHAELDDVIKASLEKVREFTKEQYLAMDERARIFYLNDSTGTVPEETKDQWRQWLVEDAA